MILAILLFLGGVQAFKTLAAAAALAFGLGGRDEAARTIAAWRAKG